MARFHVSERQALTLHINPDYTMDDTDSLPTISGRDIIMAYGGEPRYYVKHSSDSNVCTCLFWSRYSLFVLNFLVMAAGVTMIGLGAWAHINGEGLQLFETLLTVPSWLLIGTGIVMVLVGVFGCAGALRLNVFCLRVFMVVVISVFILQLVLGAVVFFLMDAVQDRMLHIVKDAVINYQMDDNVDRDRAMDYLQREFKCCGGSSYSDWDANVYYNCSSQTSAAKCGAPASCCRGAKDEQCGYGVRGGTEEYTDMFIYTQGCIVVLMHIFKQNVIIIAALSLSVCLLEIFCLVLANVIVRQMVYHRKLLP